MHNPEVRAKFPALEMKDLLEELHAVDDQGTVYRGARAINEILRRQPGLKGWLAYAWYIPGYAWLAERQYKRIAASRYQRDASGRLREGSDTSLTSYHADDDVGVSMALWLQFRSQDVCRSAPMSSRRRLRSTAADTLVATAGGVRMHRLPMRIRSLVRALPYKGRLVEGDPDRASAGGREWRCRKMRR